MIKRKKILVIGDIMLDRYWVGSVNRISPEAPVPIVDVDSSTDKPGGAANVAKNLSDFGMDATLVGIAGKDEAAEKLSALMSSLNVVYKPLVDSKVRTTMKLRVIDKNKQLMRIDHEDKHKSKVASSLYKTVEPIIDSFDAIIISDYGKGAVKPIIKKVLKITSKLNIMTFIDPKGDDFTFYKGAYLLKPNQKEFENIMGTSKTTNEFKAKGEKLRKELKLNSLLVTRGKDGMMLFEKNKITSLKAIQQDVFDVTGAGDTVISIVASYMTSGESMISAVTMSNIAAGLSVQKLGSTSVSQEDLSNAANK